MNIKDLFKSIENTNKLNALILEKERTIIMYFDGMTEKHVFKSYKNFVKYVKSEYTDFYCETLLNIDLLKVANFEYDYIDVNFAVEIPFINRQESCRLEIVID